MAQRIGLPLFDLLKKRNVRKFLSEFNEVLLMRRQDIEKYQFYKLKKLLTHAYHHVPFYRDRMQKSGIHPASLEVFSQFSQLPVLTRSDLQNSYEKLFADNYVRQLLTKGSSSGSTGIPVVYYKDADASSAGQAANMIGWGIAGWNLGDKGLHIWGNPTIVKDEWRRPSSKLKALLYNHHKFEAYRLTEAKKFAELIEKLNKEKYIFIDGYTNAIYLLGDYLKQNNRRIAKLRYVFTTGENLLEYQRNLIEDWLGTVYDSYGCSEINGIGYECPYCGEYHTIDPHVLVEFGEILDDEGTCELIITDLDNYGFPLIRYKNGDCVIPTDGSHICKVVPFKTFHKIMGRQSDIIKLPGGGVLSVPSFFGSMLLKKLDGIRQYQIERTSSTNLVIKFVLNKSYTHEYRKIVDNALKDYLGSKMTWEVRIVDSIEVSTNGKFKLLLDKTNAN